MANIKKSTDVNLTVFDILQAVTGELPCYASPNWNVSATKEDLSKKRHSKAEDQAEKPLAHEGNESPLQ